MTPAPRSSPRANWREMLASTLYQNLKVTATWNKDGTQLGLAIPTKRPGYLIPPITWVVRPPAFRTLYIDRIAADLWFWCDGTRTVEDVIELFARKHTLTFHESRVSVTTYLKELVKRGALAVAI